MSAESRGNTQDKRRLDSAETRKGRASLFALRLICAINGVCAIIFGAVMMVFPADAPWGLSELVPSLQAMPLPSFMLDTLFWPGLALLLVNGVANAIASALFFVRRPVDRVALCWALLAGVLLVCWSVFELAFIPNALSVFYLIVGIAQIALAVKALRSAGSLPTPKP